MGKLRNLKFGDIVVNYNAGRDNPRRYGYFVEYKKITGIVNRGTHIRLTDRKGSFWLLANDKDTNAEVVSAQP